MKRTHISRARSVFTGIRGALIRFLVSLLRRLLPKHATYFQEANVAAGILARLRMQYTVMLIRDRLKHMAKVEGKKKWRKK